MPAANHKRGTGIRAKRAQSKRKPTSRDRFGFRLKEPSKFNSLELAEKVNRLLQKIGFKVGTVKMQTGWIRQQSEKVPTYNLVDYLSSREFIGKGQVTYNEARPISSRNKSTS